ISGSSLSTVDTFRPTPFHRQKRTDRSEAALSFLTIGHRGVMGVEPENTLRSFVRAEREGLDVIELDLHLSKDGALVVMHDADVDRTTDGTGPIAERTLAELRDLDAGRGERSRASEGGGAGVTARF